MSREMTPGPGTKRGIPLPGLPMFKFRDMALDGLSQVHSSTPPARKVQCHVLQAVTTRMSFEAVFCHDFTPRSKRDRGGMVQITSDEASMHCKPFRNKYRLSDLMHDTGEMRSL